MKLNWFSHVRIQCMPYTIAFVLILRIFLILVGDIIDDVSSDIKYTDVDYYVFTDASRLMWDGNSPYTRDTYRYSPLLAFMLIPNIFFPSYGKVAVTLMYLLFSQMTTHHKKLLTISYLLNCRFYFPLRMWELFGEF